MTPAIAVLNKLQQRIGDTLEVTFICDRGFYKQTMSIVATANQPIKVRTIVSGKLRRYHNFKLIDYLAHPSIIFNNLIDIFKVMIGFLQSIFIIIRLRPDVVFCKGGFVCLPVGWAASLLGIPIVIHDSDARPGLTNRFLAPFASKIATGYPLEYYPYDKSKSTYTGVPIRDQFVPVNAEKQRELKRRAGVDAKDLLIVSFGGGLGSQAINEAIVSSLARLNDMPVRVVAISGIKHFEEMNKAVGDSGSTRIVVKDFVSDGMAELLSAADIVVTRASATALQELSGLAKAIVVVPARQLSDQHKNAELLASRGAAIVLNDQELAEGRLADALMDLASDETKRHQLAESLHQLAMYDAAERVAELVYTAYRGATE